MLRDATSVRGDDEVTWSGTTSNEPTETDASAWKTVDSKLRGIARRRAALDAEEATWLREAERVEVWKPLGMVNLLDYLERVLGYAPRTAQQRLQVARALATLPAMTDALATGALAFSAIRELARVATPATERAWCAHVGAMNLRQIEEAVAGHRPGDLPTDPPDDEAREHAVTLRLSAAAFARYRQGRIQLDEEHDHRLDDSELVEALFAPARDGGDGEISGRAKFQIALHVCPRCERGWQEGAGARVPVDAATVERAHCDAQHIGSLDVGVPERAHQDVPPNVVRFVWRRDGGRCQTPGCRSSRGLELHHIVHREHGGSHDATNLTLRCSACHIAHHRGLLDISGEAPDHIVTTRRNAPIDAAATTGSHVGARQLIDHARPEGAGRGAADGAASVPERTASTNAATSRFAQAAMRTQARDALTGLGWKIGIATTAVDEARAHVGATCTLEELIREALRRCPMPRA